MQARLADHAELSAWFAERTDAELVELLADSAPTAGWGMTRVIEALGRAVFVKTLPLTDLEAAHPGSTRNLFDLPLVYHYGVGSAGFGAQRELAAHVTTTRWVHEGRTANFPLLHHHRLLPLGGQTRRLDPDRLDRYVASWDGHTSIRRFIEAREKSTTSIAMFLEHLPHSLDHWLPLHQEAITAVIRQGLDITAFLRDQQIVHFDVNPTNLLTDGTTLYFGDFGLLLDAEFDLDDTERSFLDRHRYFDAGEFLASLSWPGPAQPVEHGPGYRRALAPYRAVIEEMSDVFGRLAAGPRHTAGYDDERVESALDAAAEHPR